MTLAPPCVAAALVVATALATAPALAQGNFAKKGDLDTAIVKLASGIQERLKDKSQTVVSIGEFAGPNKLKINISARLKVDLERHVKAKGLSVSDDAKLEVRGDYTLVEDPEDRDLHALHLKVRFIETDSNSELAGLSLEAYVRDNGDLAKLTGATATLPPTADRKDRNGALFDGVTNPHVAIAATKIKASPDSPYAVELLAGADLAQAGPPRAITEVGGRAFAAINRNEYYQIRLHNGAPHDVACTITIDGLDLYAFSEDLDPKTHQSKFKHVIIPANTNGIVRGWHHKIGPDGFGQVFSFVVTALGQGAASQKGVKPGSIGVITVTFAAAWPKGGTPPSDEGKRSASNETGKGPPLKVGMKAVEREIGVVREVVSVRYSH